MVSLSDSTIGCARGRLAVRGLRYCIAPPLETDARHHRLARDSACAGKLVIEGEHRQQVAPLRLGREQHAEEAVAIGCPHLGEHVAVRRLGRRGRNCSWQPLNETVSEITM